MKLNTFFKKKAKSSAYKCPHCGKIYNEIPLCFGSDYPHYYHSIPHEERKDRVKMDQSWCVVDDTHFFHRCRLIIPIIDYKEDLEFNVWTSISEDNFSIRMDLWNNPDRVHQQPYFGWLQTRIDFYRETINIKSIAVEQPVGIIPVLKMIEEGHALTIDQENGISYEKAKLIAGTILKDQHTCAPKTTNAR